MKLSILCYVLFQMTEFSITYSLSSPKVILTFPRKWQPSHSSITVPAIAEDMLLCKTIQRLKRDNPTTGLPNNKASIS